MAIVKMASEEFAQQVADEKYEKPSGGIPKTDLAPGVQASLDAADAAAPASTTYTKTEVDAIIQALKTGSRVIVQSLPASGDPMVIYMVPKSAAQTNNLYDEYIWTAAGAWEKIGDTTIDLSGKADKVGGATAGNLAGLDQYGNLTDRGVKPGDFAAATHSHAQSDVTGLSAALAALAPDWASGASYAQYDVVKHNGIYYYAKDNLADSQTAPSSDATNWGSLANLAALAHQFLPLTGGIINGDLKVVYSNNGFTVEDSSGNSLSIKHETAAGNFWYINYSITGVGSGSLRLPFDNIIPADVVSIADYFDSTRTYELNSLCVKGDDGLLYRCKNQNGHSGEWVDADFTLATVEDVLAALRTAMAGKANASDLLAKLDSTSAAPAFSTDSSTQYAVGSHVTYNGKLYKCTTATTGGTWVAGSWTEDTMLANIPYTLGTPIVINTASSEVVEGETVYYGAATLADRTANIVQVTAATALDELRITFPTATSGKVRDFGLRLTVASGITTAPELALPQGVVCENADGEAPEIGADGAATILYFTETAANVFLVKGEVVTAIS